MIKCIYLTSDELRIFANMYEDAKRDREAMIDGTSEDDKGHAQAKKELEEYTKLKQTILGRN